MLLFLAFLAPVQVAAGQYPVSVEFFGPHGIQAGTIVDAAFTWTELPDSLQKDDPVVVRFYSGDALQFTDCHRFPADLSRTGDRRACGYVVPILLPPWNVFKRLSVSIEINGVEYNDIAEIDIAEQSVYLPPPKPVASQGLHTLINADQVVVSGFHAKEHNPETGDVWRWMKGTGVINVPNPRTHFKIDWTAWLPTPTGVSVVVNGREVYSSKRQDSLFDGSVSIPADFDNDSDRLEIRFQVDTIHDPSRETNSVDTRELGMMVKLLKLNVDSCPGVDHLLFDFLADQQIESSWRWIETAASVEYINPHALSRLFISGWSPEVGRILHILINDVEIDAVLISQNAFRVCYELPKHLLGAREKIRVALQQECPNLALAGSGGSGPALVIKQLHLD